MSEPDEVVVAIPVPWLLAFVSGILGFITTLVAIVFPWFLHLSAVFIVTAGIGIAWMVWEGKDARTMEKREIYK